MKSLTPIHILLLAACLIASGCFRAETQSPVLAQTNVSPSPSPNVVASPSASKSQIRSVDFENFTFPAKPLYSTGEKSFTLKDGKYAGRLLDGGLEPEPVYLVETVYGDVTGDGNEEALAVITISIRGTAIPYFVYIHSMVRNKPKLIWSFESGDRAEGGLRQTYAENGLLVVELYGKNKFIGADLYADDDSIRGACCPSVYTRSRYEWRGNRFRHKDQLEVVENPDGSAPFLPLLEKRN